MSGRLKETVPTGGGAVLRIGIVVVVRIEPDVAVAVPVEVRRILGVRGMDRPA